MTALINYRLISTTRLSSTKKFWKWLFHIAQCAPTKIMSDFELAIINACTEVFPGVPLSDCYFHLGQIIIQKGSRQWTTRTVPRSTG